jgi:quercetin dioxygenase-like cupin family protein
LLVIATPAGMERYHEEAGQVATARTLPPQPLALQAHVAARLAQKYRFELQGHPPMSVSEPLTLPSAAETVLWMRNFLIVCRALAKDTGGALSVLEFTVAHGDGPPFHTHHNEDETFLVLDGRFFIQIGDTRYDVRPGGCVFGPRHLPHGFVNAGPLPARLLVIATPAGIEGYFAESGRPAAARRLPEPAGAPDLELASRLGAKYKFDVVGPPLHIK